MTWTPLIAATDFDGIRADLLTSTAGLLSIVLIILGVGVLYRVFSR